MLGVDDRQERFQATQDAVAAPVLRQLDRCPGQVAREAIELLLAEVQKEVQLSLSPRGQEAKGVNEIDAISGATMTSEVFINMINEAVANFRKVLGR